jgi:hypothetical protein
MAVWLLAGCAPSKESMTAGHVGCLPSEIRISGDDSNVGLTESSQTWLATCRGRTYVCSKTTSGGWAAAVAAKPSPPPSSQLACHEQVPAAPVASASSAPSVPAAAPANTAARQSAPPKGAGGFDFGLSAAAAKATCEAGAKVWDDSKPIATCSGTTTNVGFQAMVSLKFCGDSTCFISLRVADAPDWSVAVDELKTKLSAKYGEPATATPLRAECVGADGFARCFKEGDERLHYTWTWSSGEQLLLVVGKPSKGGEAAIRLQYKRDPGRLSVDTAGL